jgi:hypothetical protein
VINLEPTDIALLRDRHVGETASIIGRGPSLLKLKAEDVPPGPVITLNAAVIQVRKLGLPNHIYMQWKDGCQQHTWLDNDPASPHGCTLPSPDPGETLLLSLAESRYCQMDAPDRHVMDVKGWFGVDWWKMSAPVAVCVAELLGCRDIVFFGCDAYTSTNTENRAVLPNGVLEDHPQWSYYRAGLEAQTIADERGITTSWR